MIYTPKIKKAMIIAYNAHNGQVDKSGIPYIYHPIHLAEQMNTETECIVALLHDVVEDTNVTFDELEKEFSPEIIEALKLLTHDKNVDYLNELNKKDRMGMAGYTSLILIITSAITFGMYLALKLIG